jgi:two-component system chemotaxis response regulator CheY
MLAPSPTLRVLVVDDDEDITEMLSMALEVNGLEVAGVAHSGPEAVDLAGRTQPDVVLLDQVMPRMTGLEAVPELQAIAPRSKVCMHSAIGATTMTESALAAGVEGYIEKGVRPRSIVAHLRRMMADDAGPGAGPVRPLPLRRDYS